MMRHQLGSGTIASLLLVSYILLWISSCYFSSSLLQSPLGRVELRDYFTSFPKDHNVRIGGQESDKIQIHKQGLKQNRPVLTAYIQKSEKNDDNETSLKLYQLEYPQAYSYLEEDTNLSGNRNPKNNGATIYPFPIIDDYPDGDPFLPWIHDVHPSHDGSSIKIYAQNRRRCHTGEDNVELMKQLEPQMALFQPIAIATEPSDSSNIDTETSSKYRYRVSSYKDANPKTKETRFICRFKDYNTKNKKTWITFSTYPFNYEYITWRKRKKTMFERTGKESGQFWLSSLQFDCPVPDEIQNNVNSGGHGHGDTTIGIQSYDKLYLDIVPIRTPVRYFQFFFHKGHGGPTDFDIDKEWGRDMYLPPIDQSSRWENIYIQNLPTPLSHEKNYSIESTSDSASTNSVNINAKESTSTSTNTIDKKKKPFQLVACTWTSASHNRRGDRATLNDGKGRLKEWIAFHLLVGYDHIVVYDNSAANTNRTTLKDVTDQFGSDVVTYVSWGCKICNNNKPANADPGERSSQYAAESSCRGRFAPYTEWMSFMDPDEYMVPMGEFNSWKEILPILDKEGKKILKFRSSRARPLPSLMKPVYGPKTPKCPTLEEVNGPILRKASCLVPNEEYTFLQVYNCEYIKSPKPERFQRAMKQIYRPDYVLSHFVHYSTVTTDFARTKEESKPDEYSYFARTSDPQTERFIDEINEGVLIHAKSFVPEEAIHRDVRCKHGMHPGCNVGIPCPDDLPFDDATHQGGFLDHDGNFCNCWVNRKVDDIWLPKLEDSLRKLSDNNKNKKR